MNGHVSRDGITKDLEAMKQVGLGGFHAFHIETSIPAGPIRYLSPQWRELMQHTLRQADRLGLEVCLHNCAGWSSSGGPWVTPDKSMLEVVWSEKRVKGPTSSTAVQQPTAMLGYYRDIVTLAFPTPAAEREGGPGFRIDGVRGKAGFDRLDAPQHDPRTAPPEAIIPRDALVNLTDRLSTDGSVEWEFPAGDWTVIRFGYTPTMRTNHPAPPEGRGLECDKLSTAGARQHWDGIVQKVIDDAGPLAPRTLTSVLIDSYETGQQNWTHGFDREFRERRGYDMLTLFPAITGRVVDSVEVTERFLWDYRRTIADLFCENYYGYFAKLCHERGLRLCIEPYGGWVGNFHDLEVAAQADLPMGEFWANRPMDWCEWSVKLAASAAHVTGKKYVGAESFTSGPNEANWTLSPGALKAQGDYYFAKGLNRIIFHTYVHKPWSDAVRPGMTMSQYGMQLNRKNTWFDDARPWMDYLARCQHLLQEGRFVADLCYVWDENAPNRMKRHDELSPPPPAGYDYDGTTSHTLSTMQVDAGDIVLPSGMRYRVLVLPNQDAMRPETLRQVKRLVEAGATAIGPRPSVSPSLSDFPRCDDEIRQLAAGLWDSGKIASPNRPLAELLRERGALPDFELLDKSDAQPFNYLHRQIDDADVYFVSNQWDRPVEAECAFRAPEGQPELWAPETGEKRLASLWRRLDDGRAALVLALEPAESVFVVFRPGSQPHPHAISASGPDGQLSGALSYPDIVIQQATYGVLDGDADQQVDCTEVVRDMMNRRAGRLLASNALAGDPAQNIVKQLRVRYTVDGQRLVRVLNEHEGTSLLSLPSATHFPTARLSQRGNELELQTYSGGDYQVTLADGQPVKFSIDKPPAPLTIAGPWELTLRSALPSEDSPVRRRLERLGTLPEHQDDELRYFAGTATYRTRFDAPAERLESNHRSLLNLGEVAVIARVELNGEPLGTLWKTPYRLDVTSALRPGRNELTVHVTTLWPNRLIGEERRTDPSHTERGLRGRQIPAWIANGGPPPGDASGVYSTWRHWLASDDLVPSGLIGPVRIHTGVAVPVTP